MPQHVCGTLADWYSRIFGDHEESLEKEFDCRSVASGVRNVSGPVDGANF
jgi:hypothetical protein